MFRFEEQNYFLLLLALPLIYFLYKWSIRKSEQKLNILGDYQILKRQISNPFKYQNYKIILFLLATTFSILALVNPQFGKRMEKVKSSNVDIFIALDLSTSMLAEDIQPNRLQIAHTKNKICQYPTEKSSVGLSFPPIKNHNEPKDNRH